MPRGKALRSYVVKWFRVGGCQSERYGQKKFGAELDPSCNGLRVLLSLWYRVPQIDLKIQREPTISRSPPLK